jgi:MoxR-like ATPase
MHVDIDYPDAETELEILRLTRGEALSVPPVTPPKLTQQDIFSSRKEALALHMAPELEQYLVQLVMATRQPAKFDANLAEWIAMGTSPRATISLDRCARAHAWLSGRDFVGPDDIQAVVHNVLRHRIILSYHAEAQGITMNDVLNQIVATVAVP